MKYSRSTPSPCAASRWLAVLSLALAAAFATAVAQQTDEEPLPDLFNSLEETTETEENAPEEAEDIPLEDFFATEEEPPAEEATTDEESADEDDAPLGDLFNELEEEPVAEEASAEEEDSLDSLFTELEATPAEETPETAPAEDQVDNKAGEPGGDQGAEKDEVGNIMERLMFFGRFHIVFLHFPIGLLAISAILELTSYKEGNEWAHPAVVVALFWASLGGIVAAVFGWILASPEGEYNEELIFWHRWLGVATAVGTILSYVMKKYAMKTRSQGSRVAFSSVFALTFAVMLIGSHYGGSITHGSNYLVYYWDSLIGKVEAGDNQPQPLDFENDKIYDVVIKPIFNQSCIECHGPEKTKGKLRMDTLEGVKLGGSEGDFIVPGDLPASNLHFRITLPADDADVMPPEGEKPLTQEQIKLIEWWIEKGHASFDMTIDAAEKDDEILGILKSLKKVPGGAQALAPVEEEAPGVPAANPQDIVALEDRGVLVMPLSQNTNELSVQASMAGEKFTDEEAKLLLPIAEQLRWAYLGKTGVTDAALEVIGQLKNVTRLQLHQTKITDQALDELAKLENLEYINLYGTEVGDKIFGVLGQLPNLKKVFLWQTNATPEAAKAFVEANPEILVNIGWEHPLVEIPAPRELDEAEEIAKLEAQKEAEEKRQAALANTAFGKVIQPIFDAKCVQCHGPDKKKGKLRLDLQEHITEGGGEGPAIVGGNLLDSNVWFRITLPEDDSDVMPPEDEERLTEAEKKLIKWWIEAGAPYDKKLEEIDTNEEITQALKEIGTT